MPTFFLITQAMQDFAAVFMIWPNKFSMSMEISDVWFKERKKAEKVFFFYRPVITGYLTCFFLH